MRCFAAIDIDKELKEKIIILQKEISKINNVKLVERKNLHITLKFFGKVNENEIITIKNKIREITQQFHPFRINIRGLGVFPNLSYIRVIWLGVSENLVKIQEAIKTEFPDTTRKEVPHITIARVKTGRNKDVIREFIEKNKDIKIGYMNIKNITLKESNLTEKGPIYRDIEIFSL